MQIIPQAHPAERRRETHRFTVLYDAACGFCTATTRWLGRRDHAGRLTFLPLQEAIRSDRPLVRDVALAHDLSAALHVVDEQDGRVEAAGGAMLAVLGVLPHWGTIARLAGLGPARRGTELVYRSVAHHRDRVGRLLGVPDTGCVMPHGQQGGST